MTKTILLFLTIAIEGYVVLACELLAIRQLLPFVGSGVEVVAIVISGVLLPLAFGYHFGGSAYARACARARRRNRPSPSIRRILLHNIVLALLILAVGLSILFQGFFFAFLSRHGMQHRLMQTSIYTALFLVLPVFLLGQTVPLVSNYFSRRQISEITGKMLFFSTAGSFLGSIFSTLVLMMTVGVNNTVIVTLGLLCVLCILLSRRKQDRYALSAIGIFLIVILINCDPPLRAMHIVSNNAYNLVRIYPDKDDSTLIELNLYVSSKFATDPEKRYPYINFVNKNFIDTMPKTGTPHDILVIGAAGFTVGQDDTFNNYNFVDIDPDQKKLAEKYVWPQPLTPNKKFTPSSARAFLRQETAKYDLIFIDVFQNVTAIPQECTTQEFLQSVKDHLKDNGILAINVIMTPDFQDLFSVRYDRTFASVFPVHTRQIIADSFNPWQQDDSFTTVRKSRNIIYTYFNRAAAREDSGIYTDDLNTYSIDRL